MTQLTSASRFPWELLLPPEFEHDVYVGHPKNQDISALDKEHAMGHYRTHGRAEGRVCDKIACRRDFIALVPPDKPILEIGPFFAPAFTKSEANVSYLDCLSTTAMKSRAASIKDSAVESIPDIDYVWSGERYSHLVGDKFLSVYSSHNIEHQPCLVTHLRDIASVLQEDGAVFLVVPDKRYCFDHFLSESTLADVLDAWFSKRKQHRLKDVLDHRFFTTHNDPVRHWRGDHGVNRASVRLAAGQDKVFLSEIERLVASEDYNDVHAWKFVPDTFRLLLDELYRLKLTTLRPIRLYSTIRDSNEFYAVLIPGSTES